MKKKESFSYKGYNEKELKNLSLDEFAEIVDSKSRRKIKRGFTHQEEKLIEKLKKGKDNVKTHARSMVVLPIMVGKTIKIHNGKEYKDLTILPQMLGHRLGEFSLSRQFVQHGMPGIGSSRSTLHVSMR